MPRYIEQLTENTTPASGDWLWIVDVDAGATDQDRKLSVGKLALLATANVFTGTQTIAPSSSSVASMVINTAASPTSYVWGLQRNSTHKLSLRLTDANFLEERRNFVSVADMASIALVYSAGLVEIFDASQGNYGLFLIRGSNNTVVELLDSGAAFSVTKSTASSFNVYYEESMYHVENQRGGARNLAIKFTSGSASA